MAPAIAKTAQMRRTSALVGPQRNWNFRNLCVELCRLDYELRRKLHARAAQVHLIVNRARESTHATVTVSNPGVKEKIEEPRQSRISDVLVVPWHRAAFDFPTEAIAHHHVVSLSPHFDKARHVGEVVAIVGVAHDDELPARGCDSRPKC